MLEFEEPQGYWLECYLTSKHEVIGPITCSGETMFSLTHTQKTQKNHKEDIMTEALKRSMHPAPQKADAWFKSDDTNKLYMQHMECINVQLLNTHRFTWKAGKPPVTFLSLWVEKHCSDKCTLDRKGACPKWSTVEKYCWLSQQFNPNLSVPNNVPPAYHN